ncbi:hypothetical protein DICVIV_02371 [Dictyocaulus viviparus]|uniref:Chondroitin proteoglycan 3 n=1 Tax=Dictyocaulus viviparus TaxID=29172 RepID=A0A0D8Y632_DICVI|nr:hypothetical protein DICVIV_02371 [Dictyocaulus viviparus]
MLLSIIFLFLVYRISESALPIKEDNDDNLFLSLDQEIEDALQEAFIESPNNLVDETVQHIEGSGSEESSDKIKFSHEDQSVAKFLSETTPDNLMTNEVVQIDNNITFIRNHSSVLKSSPPYPTYLPPPWNYVSVGEINEGSGDSIDEALASIDNTSSETPTSSIITSNVSLEAVLTSTAAYSISLTSYKKKSTVASSTLKKVYSNFHEYNHKGCHVNRTCYRDSDCGKGICLGANIGTCNCHACINNIPCENDDFCGGLNNSCRNGYCKCAEALALHGFPFFIVALKEFCSQRSCNDDSESCFGLPCNHGICSCN